MIRVKEAIIVEGKYDKVKLSSLIDGLILETRGFGIFKDKRQMELIRKLADTRGIIIFTDSDAAGFVIRGHLNSSIDNSKIKHAYIPDVFGKEKRKEKASKEGKLGVEGVDAALILEALTRAGATVLGNETTSETVSVPPDSRITKADLFAWGLSGGEGSSERRRLLLDCLKLPEHLAPNSLVKVLNSMFTREDFENLIQKLFSEKEGEKERNF
ncbi:MAG: DUF4093 domain-containing protein [Clostridiales bacterium]|nr:DUF4093 domain-containing protein [Clostridiales bacterium]